MRLTNTRTQHVIPRPLKLSIGGALQGNFFKNIAKKGEMIFFKPAVPQNDI